MEVIPLVRNTVEQIVVYRRSWRKVEVIQLVRNSTVGQIVVRQIMAKSGGDSACAYRLGSDRGQPVPQIMPKTWRWFSLSWPASATDHGHNRWSACLADFTSIFRDFLGAIDG